MMTPLGSFTDIAFGGWLDRVLPESWRPYAQLARLDRPIGWWLLLFPCWWSLALARPGHPPWPLFLLFMVGAITMRGAGCTLNDIIDRDFDARVERTRARPIPSGRVSVSQAWRFLFGQLALGALVLLCLPGFTIALGLGVLALVASYPFMKRITFWPQLFLGLNFNWGALMAWSAVTGGIDAPAVALYAAGIVWTLGYDTIYAHQDKTDDIAIGVKSTALKFGTASKIWVGGFYAASWLLLALALGLAHAGWIGYILLIPVALHFRWQVTSWDMDDPANCLAKFKSNRGVGWLVLAALLLAGWV